MNLSSNEKWISMASTIPENVAKHVTTHELSENFHFRSREYHKRASFVWTLLVNMVNASLALDL